jgi:hypothetical protein
MIFPAVILALLVISHLLSKLQRIV